MTATPARNAELDRLFRELQPGLVRYADGLLGNRSDAEEVVQDAFLAASRSLAGGGLDDPRPWLYRVTRNAAVDRIRRRRLAPVPGDIGDDHVSPDTSPVHAAELSADLEMLQVGLDRLSEQQRSALVLRELSGLSYAEIAEVLDVSESNVKVIIFRARKSLQALADAAAIHCDDAQVALSARKDGEVGRGEAASARLHAATCRHCRAFERAISRQSAGLAALFPVAAVGLKAGGGLGGLLGAKAAAVAIAAVTVVGGGGAAVYEAVHATHGAPPHPAVTRSHSPQSGVAAAPRPIPAEDGRHGSGEIGDDHGGRGSEHSGRAAEGETEGGGRHSGGSAGATESGSGRTSGGSGSDSTSGGSGKTTSGGSSGGSGKTTSGGGSGGHGADG